MLKRLKRAKNNPDNFRWLIMLTVIVGTFLGRLDQTIVNLALPKIIGEFNITVSSAGWIATAYILANAIFRPYLGKTGRHDREKENLYPGLFHIHFWFRSWRVLLGISVR